MTTFIGGNMYGDGTWVVEFHKSSVAPLSATIMGPGAFRGCSFEMGAKPSVKLAAQVIAMAKAAA